MSNENDNEGRSRADERPFRILSIDGGGIRGLIPVIFLRAFEKRLGETLSEHFDMIAGASTGAIIAASLAAGKPLGDVYQLYIKKGEKIFPYRSRWSPRRIGLLFRHGLSAPKFSSRVLASLLEEQLGEAVVGDSRCDLLIPFYDTVGRQTHFFKSYGNDDPELDLAASRLWEAALSSSSAPTFFPAHELRVGNRRLSAIDGGVAANNPAACAAADSRNRAADGQPLVMLSLGTGRQTRPISMRKARNAGAVQWAVPIIDVLMDGALDVARYIGREMVRPENSFRLDFRLEAADFDGIERLSDDMDNASPENLEALESAAMQYLERDGNDIFDRYLSVATLSSQ